MKYRIINDHGVYEGMKFLNDKEYTSVNEAVKEAITSNYSTPFLIVSVIDWESCVKCPFPDCPKVKYKDCPVHGV